MANIDDSDELKKQDESAGTLQPACSFDLSETQEIIMPLILWLLGVPLSVVVLLYLVGVV